MLDYLLLWMTFASLPIIYALSSDTTSWLWNSNYHWINLYCFVLCCTFSTSHNYRCILLVRLCFTVLIIFTSLLYLNSEVHACHLCNFVDKIYLSFWFMLLSLWESLIRIDRSIIYITECSWLVYILHKNF